MNKLNRKKFRLNKLPICHLYYVSLGRDEKDQNNIAKIEMAKERILSESVFSKVEFELNGATDIQAKYKKIGESISKSFEFPIRATFPIIQKVEEAYIGVIDANTIITLMTDEDGNLIEKVFYDNVRDFQGVTNKVNKEIATTIKSENKDTFAILNNGITIVAENIKQRRDTFTIFHPQIINGCQTSHVLFENRDYITDKSRFL